MVSFSQIKTICEIKFLLQCTLGRNTEMSIYLFKHNQKAYKSVTAMLERVGMAAVIHPDISCGSHQANISIRLRLRTSEWNLRTFILCLTAV